MNDNKNSLIPKDACTNCKTLKAKESVQLTYNCDNVFQLDDVKRKIAKTNLIKYGAENPFQSKEIKEKIRDTNIKKYGYETATQSPEAKEKMRQYCIENFGIPYMPQLNITHQKGHLSPRWKGGVNYNGNYRQTYEYNDWRNFVLKRDNYTCQCCGDRNGNGHRVRLHAHHIFNFADNPELIYEKDNGICLCKNCHYLFHSEYGMNNTTKTQLNNFLLNHGKKVC